jgi:hypothetical protein
LETQSGSLLRTFLTMAGMLFSSVPGSSEFAFAMLATSKTFPPLFTMLVQLVALLRCLATDSQSASIPADDSEVFHSRTRCEPFEGAQRVDNGRTALSLIDCITIDRLANSKEADCLHLIIRRIP